MISRAVKECTDGNLTIDFDNEFFATPVFVVTSMVLMHSRKDVNVTIGNCTQYMQNIKYDVGGIEAGEMRPTEFTASIESYAGKSYIPLTKFPTNGGRLMDKGSIICSVENILINSARLDNNIANAIRYMLSEITDNVSEHSNAESGYIIAQNYPNMKYVDICIGDDGITLLGSYLKTPEKGITTDLDAIQAANEGISTKMRPAAENRGYGIRTTKRMIVDGMGGQYVMMSGGAAYIKTVNGERLGQMDKSSRINGTIVAMRVPYWNKFDFYSFVE